MSKRSKGNATEYIYWGVFPT